MLEALMKGLALWVYGLLLEIVEFIADSLLQVFNMDLAYFEANVPVTKEIVAIIIAAGWAMLIGNLTFQAMKGMMSGIGFEGEDPKILFCRTFVFAFLLVASRQICEIGLGMTAHVNILLQTPDAVRLELPPLDIFAIPGSWLLVMIIGIVVMFQIVKFFFEIAERYVVLAVLVILSPLAFAMGGSKNTEEIFKGWARMFGASCLMMMFNTVFLKLLLSAMSAVPSAGGMIPWMLLVVAIARVARKIDDIVARIGMNTARTGDPISHGGIMYPIMVARTLGGIVSKTAAAGKAAAAPSSNKKPGGGQGSASPPAPPSPPPSPSPASGGAANQPQQSNAGTSPDSSAKVSYPSGLSGASTTIPASAQTSASAGTQSAMSSAIPGAGKEPPPSRPPVGVGRSQTNNNGTMTDDVNSKRHNTEKPPLSVDSVTPGSVHENATAQANNQGQRTSPHLSVDSRTPDIQGKTRQNPGMDSAGTSPTATTETGLASARQRAKPRKPANLDIYRDDEPAKGYRANRAASVGSGSSAVSSGQAVHTSNSRFNSQSETRSVTSRQKVENSTRNTSSSASTPAAATPSTQVPPVRASSPGSGRIGGLNQPDTQRQSGSQRPSGNTSGGINRPGKPNRPDLPSRARNTGVQNATHRPEGTATSDNTKASFADRQPTRSSAMPFSPPNIQQPRPSRYKVAERKPSGQQKTIAGNGEGNSDAKPNPGRPPRGGRHP